MMMIDTERFLVEIQSRECIWNPKVKEYSIKSERRRAWEEVAGVFHPDWTSCTPEDQDKLVEELIKKWKYQKDYYFRCNKDKSGAGKKKKPNYFDALSFLDAIIYKEPKGAPSNVEDSENLEDTQNVTDGEVLNDGTLPAVPTLATKSVTMKRTQFQIKLMKSLQNREQTDGVCNSNKNFLLSLLPEMEKMNEDQNLEFRVFVLNIMKDIKTNVLPVQRNYDYVTNLLQLHMWDNGKILKLVELYHKNEVLWNTKHCNYKYNRHFKLDVWNQIACELQIESSVAEQKMHNLRSQFTREYKRVRIAKRNGQVFTPTWFAYKHLTFLVYYTSFRKKAARPKNGLQTVSDSNEEATSQVSHDEQKVEQFCEDSRDSSENLRNFSNYESCNVTSNKKQKTHASEQKTHAGERKTHVGEQKTHAGDQITHATTSQEFSRNTVTDDCSIFAEYIAREMRKIKDDTILAMAKHQITNVIFESQMKYYENIKNKREHSSTDGSSNYNSENDIRTSIELVPIKIEVD